MRREVIAVAASALALGASGCGHGSSAGSPSAAPPQTCDDAAYDVAAGWASRTVAADLWDVTASINAHALGDVVAKAPALTSDARDGVAKVTSTSPCRPRLRAERAAILHALRLWERVGQTIGKVRADGSNMPTYSARISQLIDAASKAGRDTRLAKPNG